MIYFIISIGLNILLVFLLCISITYIVFVTYEKKKIAFKSYEEEIKYYMEDDIY